jgi:hypothetical protein
MEENQKLYYLTHKVWTQAKEPPKSNFTSQPPRLVRAEQKEKVGNYIQTKLPFQRGEQGPRGTQPMEQQDEWQPWGKFPE